MPPLDLRFATYIVDPSVDTIYASQGPAFHRWLPDGSADAIKIDVPKSSATVRLWCERRGFVEDKGFLRYKNDRHEVDPDVMARQGWVDGGALYGSIHLANIPEGQANAVEERKINSRDYLALGKHVVQNILDPVLERFTKVLRDTFGQYWIRVPEPFDSRRYSLGQHCNLLNIKWRDRNGVWQEFIPTDRTHEPITVRLSTVPYNEFLTRDDWTRIQELLRTSHEPSLAATVACRVTRLLHEDRISHALIELVTALEIAVEERVRHALHDNLTLREAIAPFWNEPLKTRLTMAASLGTTIAPPDLLAALKCIEQRHAVVHEGADPGHDAPTLIPQALRVVGALAVPPVIKRPPAPIGNELRAKPEDWLTGA